MQTWIEVGGVRVDVVRKRIKNVHLSVHPPTGRVRIAAPERVNLDTIRVFAISKLPWIRRHQRKLLAQERESPREYLPRESHYVWGQRRLLRITEQNGKPAVSLSHRYITLLVRPGTPASRRAELLHEWHKSLLHQIVPDLIRCWEPRLGVKVRAYYVQRMRTKWGSCNHRAGHIRLNTELAKKPKRLLEYVIVHEMAHLLEPNHGDRFVAILDAHFAGWRQARAELNQLPLTAEAWNE